MSSLRFRLISLVALTLVVGAVSQSAGASGAGARSSLPASAFARIGALSQWPGVRRSPALAAIGAAAARSGARSTELRSLADSSFFADRDVSFGDGAVYSASWADYDADGKLDVLTFGCTDFSCSAAVTKLFHNNGDGTFSEATKTGLSNIWWGVASWGDYDSDGRIDVLISGCTDLSCSAAVSKLYRNNGDGTFSEDTKAGLPGLGSAWDENVATWADYNNDGRLDVLLTGASAPENITFRSSGAASASFVVKLYRNNGDGSFSEDKHAGLPNLLSPLPISAAWSDYDADGYEDVLISGCSDAACSTVVGRLFHNNQNGTFSENTHAGLPGVAAVVGGNPVTWSDYDGDGRPDVLVTGMTGDLGAAIGDLQSKVADIAVPTVISKLFHNNGDGTFSEDTKAGLPEELINSATWGDYDSDGRLDILVNGCLLGDTCDFYATLFHNNGDGTFREDTSERHLSTPVQLAWGDYNSDGRLDILVSDLTWGTFSGIYKNNSTATVAPLAAPTGLKARLTAKRWITFSWGESASKTATNGITYNLRVGTTPGGSEIVSPLAETNGARQVVQYGSAEGRTFAKLRILHAGTYYWSVQAIGANFAGSTFAQEKAFAIAPKVTIKLSKIKINACGHAPLSTSVTGSVGPIFDPSVKVVLQKRFGPRAGWTKVATKATDASGAFSFSKVGKGWKRSFWLRATINSQVAIRIVSPSRHVTVKGAALCPKPKKKAKK